MSHGKSLALNKNSFLQPPDEREARIQENTKHPSVKKGKLRRPAKVYDAVAGSFTFLLRIVFNLLTITGRISTHGFMKAAAESSKYRDTASTNFEPSRPDEVLFRRKLAPTRYEETDFYYAHESLPYGLPLPSSDLLVAIHAYAADFYRHATENQGRHDYESMNDTALIAMGVLTEELAKEALGKSGDLVLVEGENLSDNEEEGIPWSVGAATRGLKRTASGHYTAVDSVGNDLNDVIRRNQKRRKVLHSSAAEPIIMKDD